MRSMQTITVRRLRWIAPFAAGAAIAAAAILPGVAAGSDHPTLPSRTAAQLLTDLATASAPSLSGTIVETARLGLPELPTAGGSAADLSLMNLVTGSHTARIWLDGPTRQRVALVGDLAESDVVHNGTALWVYSSSANTATHLTLPANSLARARSAIPTPVPTPAQVTNELLAALTPTTQVSVDATARVAGRPAYQIVIAPKDPSSLITSVTIALDSQTKMPLRVQVYGRDRGTPAFETAFTDVTFSAPPASVFAFIPPTGAQVTQSTVSQFLAHAGGTGAQMFQRSGSVPAQSGLPLTKTAAPSGTASAASRTRTIGTGWTTVVVTDGAGLTGAGGPAIGSGSLRSSDQLLSLLLRSATTVPQGRLITTALVSVLIDKDGHVYIGAVDGAALQRVAATGQPA
jgi:outer membrane lipoprotein-sorting protein